MNRLISVFGLEKLKIMVLLSKSQRNKNFLVASPDAITNFGTPRDVDVLKNLLVFS